MYRGLAIVLSTVFFLSSCRKDEPLPADKVTGNYIIVGHAYGTPSNQPEALYESLVPELATLKSNLEPVKFIFTGDVAFTSTKQNWTNIKNQLESINIFDFWVAPGNHEFYTSYFEESVQPEVFFTEKIDNNLFIILNTNFPGWTISQPQIDMIAEAILDIDDVVNIFVFSHQVWWSNDKGLPFEIIKVFANSEVLLEGPSSFWLDAFPLFESLDKRIHFFAGDIGTWSWVESYNYQQFENFNFYASGIGSGLDDNLLHLKTFESGKVEIKKVDF